MNSSTLATKHYSFLKRNINFILFGVTYPERFFSNGSISANKSTGLMLLAPKTIKFIFNSAASDAYGKIPFNVKNLNVDLATISSYKIQGPRGMGAMYMRDGINMERILEGQIGTQKLWPGVENTPLIVGFTKASELVSTSNLSVIIACLNALL